MKEPPNWDQYTDRDIQESIATNVFLSVGWLRQIFWMIVILTSVVAVLGIRYFGGLKQIWAGLP